ncbi:DMT family transporter [Bdellovibrio sp. NC01]|uniref:EamA family transporter n=1 Tax=Bdellovibrio sp. NC01 TaxID=2220073 RepID=UPI001159DA35|nr:DMT family transporter [Bdellovibrio sp. NC01]QDK39250.1 EamA family transporter [Bdellovibrio sp. NC01]
MEKLKSIILVLIAIFSIQGGASFAKQLFTVLGPGVTTFLRVWISALLLLVIFQPWKHKLTKNTWGVVALYGMSLGAMNLLFYLALQRIPLGVAVALEFTGPLAVATFASKKALDVVWALLAGLGIVLILPHANFSSSIDVIGVALALGAGFFWGLYIVFAKKVGRSIVGGSATALGMFFAALTVTPTAIPQLHFADYTLQIWLSALAVAVLSSALPYSLEMIALRSIPSKTFGVLMSLEPAVAALMGFVFLNEKLSGLQLMAILCVMVASSGSSLTSRTAEVPTQS